MSFEMDKLSFSRPKNLKFKNQKTFDERNQEDCMKGSLIVVLLLASSTGNAAHVCETSYQTKDGAVLRGLGYGGSRDKAKQAACLDMYSRWQRVFAELAKELKIGKCTYHGIQELNFICSRD